MLIGLFLRHYKIYKGARYIPFGKTLRGNFNLFIGNNGAGKSSILEALDVFFNGKSFIISHKEKRSEAFVAPVFLVPKNEPNIFSKDSLKIVNIVSDYLYSVAETKSANFKPYDLFFEQRENIQNFKNTHYLLMVGLEPDSASYSFITFDNDIRKNIESNLSDEKADKLIQCLKTDLLAQYSYLYIPVETSINDFLRLETKEMQTIMSKDIKKSIEQTLNSKVESPQDNGRAKKLSPLDIINNELDSFVSEVEKVIQAIDKDYDFKLEYKSKRKLTANHLTDVIIDAYFSRRKLRKKEKPIKDLSSGERKKALIDIAYSFLTKNSSTTKKIIFAIDEPESSLHISMCYDQFGRLQELANRFNHQMFITSHWYGALPLIETGTLYHISNLEPTPVVISELPLDNYFEERGSHPDDIQLKSFYDLASAIISSMRSQEKSWIILESEDDKKYIEYHIKTTDNIIFLPVGGCRIVKILYEYLFLPINHKADAKELKGNVLCLIDTDMNSLDLEIPSETKNKVLKFRRLQVNSNQNVELIKIDVPINFPTEIEEVLMPDKFYLALENCINKFGSQDEKDAFDNFSFDSTAINSFIKGDDSILIPKALPGRTIKVDKETIINFIDSNKKNICEEYCRLPKSSNPAWINELEKLLGL